VPEKLRILFDSDAPQRLDKHLVGLNIQELFSRTFIEKLIADDQITVNGTPIKKSYLLSRGDTIAINLPELIPADIIPEDIPLDIVYEDDYLAVINKPAGLIVHPGFGNPTGTLVNAIMYRYGSNLPLAKGANRPGIVHRLDRGTSGLVLIARDDRTQSLLSDMFAKRLVKKTYLAVSTGVPDEAEGRIETYIARSVSNPRKMIVCNDGRWALTHYRVIRYYHFFALLEVDLETGRMHQIRVHLEHLNKPVLGDLLYNSIKNVQAVVPDNMKRKVFELLTNHLKRQALHAWKLAFEHPVNHESLSFQAPLPQDIIYTLDWLEQYFAVDKLGYDKNMLIK
jgi:23S rRNA pseudouridine1911/1915/1917 synthase